MLKYKVLLEKVCPMGFLKNTISWYKSYLTEPHFTVEVGNWVNIYGRFAFGVPQGSIIDPPLFFIYANDMIQAVESNLYVYVDHSWLLIQHREVTGTKKTP